MLFDFDFNFDLYSIDKKLQGKVENVFLSLLSLFRLLIYFHFIIILCFIRQFWDEVLYSFSHTIFISWQCLILSIWFNYNSNRVYDTILIKLINFDRFVVVIGFRSVLMCARYQLTEKKEKKRKKKQKPESLKIVQRYVVLLVVAFICMFCRTK